MRSITKSRRGGFSLVEIMIVVAIIGILVAIAVPGFIRARAESQAKTCQENQFKLRGALMQYAMEKNTMTPPPYSELVGLDKYLQSTPMCPAVNEAYDIPPDHETPIVCKSGLDSHVFEE